MASSQKNLSDVGQSSLKQPGRYKIGFVVSKWNEEVTESLFAGAYDLLIKAGISKANIERITVPGSFELTLGAQWMAEKKEVDAVICLGCVIQGETKHFDFICQAVAQGITDVGLKFNKPVVFGVLTTNNLQQALDRAGGKHGNKGDEAAATALQMLSIRQ